MANRLSVSALLLVLLVMGVHQAWLQPWTLDDAYITFRYARNLAEGLGPVFNPGEVVEGYTSPLWMLVAAGLHAVGIDIDLGTKLVSGALTVASLVLIGWSHRLVSGWDARASAAALVLAGTTGVLSRWSLSGMEVPLVVFWVVLIFGLHLRCRGGDDPPWMSGVVGLLCAFAFATRADAGLIFGAIWLDRLFVQRRLDARFAALTGSFVLFGGGFWAARMSYYGYLLPNTFYVKVGSTVSQVVRGFSYLGEYQLVGWATSLAVVWFLWKGRLRARNPGLFAVVLYCGLHLLYVLAVGGDVFWGWRFFAVLTPPLALLGVLGIQDGLAAGPPQRAGWFGRVVAGMLLWQLVFFALSHKLNDRGFVSRVGREVGLFLKEHTAEDAIIAVNIAGSIPYFSERVSIDMLGLNDVHIAHVEVANMGSGRAGHEKGDGAYVLRRRPDVILLATSYGGRFPRFLGDRQLYNNDRLHREYRYERYRVGEDLKIGFFVRRAEFGGSGIQGARPFYKHNDVRRLPRNPKKEKARRLRDEGLNGAGGTEETEDLEAVGGEGAGGSGSAAPAPDPAAPTAGEGEPRPPTPASETEPG